MYRFLNSFHQAYIGELVAKKTPTEPCQSAFI